MDVNVSPSILKKWGNAGVVVSDEGHMARVRPMDVNVSPSILKSGVVLV